MKVVRPGKVSLLKKIFLVDLIKGLMLTFSYQNPSKNYTEQYPKVRPKVSERFRGAPRLNNDPISGATLCIACNLCTLACPELCIEVGWDRSDKGKKVLTTFVFDISRCMFCGLCEDACPTPCLELTQDFELASYGRKEMKWDRQKLEEGNQPVLYTK
jgi:NADH-quinone oxidoreductase subunit I